MSNLKDTDIDDLLRRASDKYPLRTDSADWDRMAAALERDTPPPDENLETEEKRKRRFLWLFLLLPLLGGAGYYVWHHGPAGSNASTGTVANSATHATSSRSTGIPAAGATPTAPTDATGTTAAASTSTNTTRTTTARSTGAPATTPARTSVKSPTNGPATTSLAATSPFYPSTHNRTPGARNGTAHNKAGRTNETPATNGTTASNESTDATGNENPLTLASNGRSRLSAEGGDQDRLFFDLQRAYIPRDYQVTVNVTAPEKAKDSTKPKQAAAKTKKFYAGLLAAPDLSTVKMQSVKGVGTTFGLLLGYSFNDRWSIETGVYVDRKKYYTGGEYFSTKEIRLPSTVDLLNVNGTCYMWEIPLSIRYNFNPGSKTSWFATAGFSTYLMTKENYTYGWKWYGSSYVRDSNWNFKNPSQYPFSIINLSAGFEQRLGKVGSLRIEPYLRIPMTGLGTGKLPIMSGGVNIGITRRLW
jgi:hypothetical protein